MGAGLAWWHQYPPAENQIGVFSCTVLENLSLPGASRQKVLVELQQGRERKSWKSLEGKAILLLSGNSRPLEHGTMLLIRRTLTPIEKPGIPGQFDAEAYYRRQGIFYQVFVDSAGWKPVPGGRPYALRSLALKSREFLEKTLARSLPLSSDASMMSALLLGIRRKMDPDLKSAYASAGLTHILAVSGMHVALIFGFFSVLLKPLKGIRKGNWLFSVSVLLLLWFYALVTGLSPSVLRAVTVFSVMQLNELLKKPPLAVNGLCFGTLILLGMDAHLVYDVGYQLSFSAVFGILSFEKAIRQWWHPRHLVLKWIWSNTTVSLAASLGTFPILMHYFHQFPVYFLLANLIAVPLSNLLIYLGIGLLIFQPVPFMAEAAGWIVHQCIGLLNTFVLFIHHLPFSNLENIYLPIPVLFGLGLSLVVLQVFFHTGRMVFFQFAIAGILLSGAAQAWDNLQLWESESQTYVLRTSKEWMLAHLQGRKGMLVVLSGTSKKEGASFEAKALHEGWHVLEVVFQKAHNQQVWHVPEKKETNLVVHQGISYLFCGRYLKTGPEMPGKVDVLILTHGGPGTLDQALRWINPKEVWVDWKDPVLQSWNSRPGNKHFKIRNFRNARCQKWETGFSGGRYQHPGPGLLQIFR
jgi:ComEC/Rec2-related protein